MSRFKPSPGAFAVVAVLMMAWPWFELERGHAARAFLGMLNGVGVALVALTFAVVERGRRP
jgi:hypothetical protein